MPTNTIDKPRSLTDERKIIFRVTAQTRPELGLPEFQAYTQSFVDHLALGIAAGTERFKFVHPGDGLTAVMASLRNRRTKGGEMGMVLGEGYRSGTGFVLTNVSEGYGFQVYPPSAGLAEVRDKLLAVERVSYRNPLEFDASGWISRAEAGQVVRFLNFLNEAKGRRKRIEAEAHKTSVEAILSDATMEISIDEKEALAERVDIENEILRVQWEKELIELKERQLDYSVRVIEAQQRLLLSGGMNTVWSEEDAARFLDNIRLLASLSLAPIINATYSVADAPQVSDGDDEEDEDDGYDDDDLYFGGDETRLT